MPVATEIDHAKKRVRFTFSGQATTDEIMLAAENALAGMRGGGGYDVLSDNRGVTSPVTAEQIRLLVSRLRQAPNLHGMRAAIVASSEASYGMVRMFSSLVEPVNIDARGFNDMESALAFLDAPHDSAGPT